MESSNTSVELRPSPPAKGATARHWLQVVADRAGLSGVTDHVQSNFTTAQAWAEVCRAGNLSDDEMARLVAVHFRLGVATLTDAEPRTARLVPESLARQYGVFPLRENDRQIVVATSDPTSPDAEQAIGFASGRLPVFEIAAPPAIEAAIDGQYSPDRMVEGLLSGVNAEEADRVTVVERGPDDLVSDDGAESEPVIKLVNLMLRDAVASRASDVHIEPGPGTGAVRFRVDGVLQRYLQLPLPALIRVVARIKVMGRLDIADRIRPQDGRATIRVDGGTFDLRISTVPTRDAEKVVIRILGTGDTTDLDSVGLRKKELERLRKGLSSREGIVVVTGPTGSGKTTTLYAVLRELATDQVNITTIEDPIEYELPGITQIQVDTKRGVTFASALRAILRQDPDIILVGEIRDIETAKVAVQAAMTGHLVLATLHTNDAVGVVQRLEDLGLDRLSIAASLRATVAQRLVRRICDECAAQGSASGCSQCGGTGFRGRLPVAEVLLVTPEFESAVARGAPSRELAQVGEATGMRRMREVATELVVARLTTAVEAERVLGGFDEPTPEQAEPHVLLVDDDGVNRTLARTLLLKAGCTVDEAGDGVEGLERLAGGRPPSLVILDLSMPRMDGREVLHRIRASTATMSLPVVVLTGCDETDTEAELMEAGADDYIRKPIDPPRFVARVKAALRRAGG